MTASTADRGPSITIDRLPAGLHAWTPAYSTTVAGSPTRKWRATLKYDLDIRPAGLLAVWVETLGVLGIGDPTPASEHAAKARELWAEAKILSIPEAERLDIAAAYAEGRTDLDELLKAAEADAIAALVRADARGRLQKMIRAAAVHHLNLGRRALYDAGESLVTDLLAPAAQNIVDQAIRGKRPDYDALTHKWNALHELARLMRGTVLEDVGGTVRDYAFARPDLVHEWRCNNSERVREVARSTVGGQVRIALAPWKGGAPTVDMKAIEEHADEWLPGLYTAAQVRSHVNKWVTL